MISLLPLLLACRSPSEPVDTSLSDTGTPDTTLPDTNQPDGDPPTDPRFESLSQLLQSELSTNDALAVSIAVYEKGEVVHAEAYGAKDIEGQEEVDTETLFQLGSVTKMFTALGLLQHSDAASLDLNTALPAVYENSEFELDETWNDGITLHHLLTHQSGMFDWLGSPSSSADSFLKTWFEQAYFKYAWLMNPSGLFYNYSNPGYSLAGLVLESLDDEGRRYPDVISDEVFQSLGMERTYLRKDDAEDDGNFAESRGYLVASDGSAVYTDISMLVLPDMAQGRPAGSGTWTTPTQLMEMARFLMNGNSDVLGEASRQAMTSKQVDMNATPFDVNLGYGYGVLVMDGLVLNGDTYYPEKIWNHDGATTSFSATFWMFPEKDAAFCILNSGYGTSFPLSLERLLTEFLVGDQDATSELPVKEHDPSQIGYRIGSYLDERNFGEVIISRDGEDLMVSMPQIDELGFSYEPTLYMDRDDHWYVQIEGTWYSWLFWGEDNAPSDYIVSRNMVATRVPDGQSARAAAGSGPTKAEFEAFLRDAPSVIPAIMRGEPDSSMPR